MKMTKTAMATTIKKAEKATKTKKTAKAERLLAGVANECMKDANG